MTYVPLLQDLEFAYLSLRHSWATEWTGLPTVMQGSLRWLLNVEQLEPHCFEPTARLDVLLSAAEAVEEQGDGVAQQGQEPSYHNRLHIADTVSGMACLLRTTRSLTGRNDTPLGHDEFLCLLSILLHDYGHTGRINQFPREIEQRSVDLFTPLLRSLKLSDDEVATVTGLVLGTDPGFVGDVHRKLSEVTVSDSRLIPEEMAVLVVEADILASAMATPGEDLGKSLILEWADGYPERAAKLGTAQGRLGFLEFGARFSSRASKELGLHVMTLAQIKELRARLEPQPSQAR